jgi:hypothetical protein
MATAATVRADGMEWPIATFIDAYGLIKVDHFAHPCLDGAARLIALTNDGRLLDAVSANMVDWHGTVAFRLVDGDRQQPCFFCGTSADADVHCEECLDSAEWDS